MVFFCQKRDSILILQEKETFPSASSSLVTQVEVRCLEDSLFKCRVCRWTWLEWLIVGLRDGDWLCWVFFA